MCLNNWVVWAMPVYMCYNMSALQLCSQHDVLYAPSASVIFPLLVERAVPAMVVWLGLRTFCSKGSEISLVHIVLCLCLARCQIERKTECKQAMALVFLIRMSGQAWEILTTAPPRRLHLTSLLLRYTLTKRVCRGLEENLNVARHWVYILVMCLQHTWAWRVYYFPHWCVLNWKRQQNGIHNPKIYSTSFHFKALWLGGEILKSKLIVFIHRKLTVTRSLMVFNVIMSSQTYLQTRFEFAQVWMWPESSQDKNFFFLCLN